MNERGRPPRAALWLIAAGVPWVVGCRGAMPKAASDEALGESLGVELSVGAGMTSKAPATSAGLFFNDSSYGDVRARTENFFAESERSPAEPQSERRMIYSASISVQVARVDEAIHRAIAAAEALGGHLSSRNNATLTLRVPAASFRELLDGLLGYGRVLSQSLTAKDVTKEYMDLAIRLENATKSRDRLLDLLDRAEKVEDVLKIEEQLRRLTTEIEEMEGLIKFLDDQIALSTITVSFQAVQEVEEGRVRRPSRFDWINQVGAENVLRRF